MPRMTGGQALIRSLVREGVEMIFGIPGVQMYGIMAALRDEPAIRMITTRSEMSTTHMADGYARAGGRVGASLVVPGPGVYNAAGGLSTAYSVSSPVLLIAGQTPIDTIGSNTGALHEVNDQMDAIKPVTKWQGRMLQPSDVAQTVHNAFRELNNGRPRPVYIDIPPEAMLDFDEIDLMESAPRERQTPSQDKLEAAAKILAGASNPVIYAGSGVLRGGAMDELEALTDKTNIPVFTSRGGKGAISDRHPHVFGGISRVAGGRLAEVIAETDVMLVIGSRLAMGKPNPDVKIIQIDADPYEIGLSGDDRLALVGDVKSTMPALGDALADAGFSQSSPVDKVAAIREELAGPEGRVEPQNTMLDDIREGFPDDGIAIYGVTQLGYVSRTYWPVYEPYTFIDSGYSENLGYAFPTALGAKVAQPDKPVLCVTGDGGFGYHTPELSTAVKYGINVVTVLFNDNAYGNVARDLDMDFGGHYEMDLHNADYMELAAAYGVEGIKVDDHSKLKNTVADAVQLDKPVLIEVPFTRMPRPWPASSRPSWTKPQK
jgi:acetolactate synthase-1/2/3 large subunit